MGLLREGASRLEQKLLRPGDKSAQHRDSISVLDDCFLFKHFSKKTLSSVLCGQSGLRFWGPETYNLEEPFNKKNAALGFKKKSGAPGWLSGF